MKKIIVFLIALVTITLIQTKEVSAKTQSFYQGEYINDIFLQKRKSNGVTLYSQAQFLRNKKTNEIAYCIEPIDFFRADYIHTETIPTNFTNQQIEDITLISHFGYGYKNHTESKWYAITQILIWEIADPSMTYFITPTKNSNDIKLFTNELQEIKNLVNNYKKQTSLNNKQFTIVEGETLNITDENNIIGNYNSSDTITIENNTLTIKELTPGTHTFSIEKESNLYNRHPIFYHHEQTQDLMQIGDPNKIIDTFNVNVINTKLKIIKIDYESNKEEAQGDATLVNSKFEIYTENDKLLKTINLSNTTEIINNLPLGNYYIKEISPGEGYELNETKYTFTISESTPTITIKIPNKVIKSKLIINKQYGTENNFRPEQNISFNIYRNNKLIETIITNEKGMAEITLPYGKYKIIQLTSTEGYSKIEPIYFEINTNTPIYYDLKDYRIEVPDTKTKSLITKIILLIKNILCGKKQF